LFNLLVKGNGWLEGIDTMPGDRLFEYTDQLIKDKFQLGSTPDFAKLIRLPSLFVEETYRGTVQLAHVGTITRARMSGHDIFLEYVYDPTIPPITNELLHSIANQLSIENFEFSRTHWAVKDVDLFCILLRNLQPRRQKPKVFQIADPENIEPTLISVMMPFHPSFDQVYAKIKATAEEFHLRCRRADDIWENPAVIQDVVSLIDRSKIVICDCTGRNPNVFYEIGIAHTLGREVILITQAEEDIPFDLRHLRYVKYLNNGEGLDDLSERLKKRLSKA